RPRGERHPVGVAALLLEPRETDPFPCACAGAGALPVPVRVDRTIDTVGVGLLRALRPPHRAGFSVDTHLVLDGVPPLPQHPQRRLRGLDAGLTPRLDISLQ